MTVIAESIPLRSRPRPAMTILCGLLALLFLVAAGMKLANADFETRSFAHFGYAPWFMVLIGLLELAGGIGLMIDRTRGVSALAMAVLMIGAVLSHLSAGDGPGMATPAAVALVLCGVVAYARRRDLWPLLRL